MTAIMGHFANLWDYLRLFNQLFLFDFMSHNVLSDLIASQSKCGAELWGNPGDMKSVGEGVLEVRIDYGPGYRVYFGQRGKRLIVLLAGGGDKRTQARDIALAKQLWENWQEEN